MSEKVILIMNIITPYNIPVYNYLASKIKNFEVYFLAATESNRQWQLPKNMNFKYKILKGLHFYVFKKEWGIHLNAGLFFGLIKARPHVVILGGYDAPSYWLTLLYCKLFKKKIGLWSGSTLFSSQCNKGVIKFLKRIFIKSADFYLAYGIKAKEYLEYCGANPSSIVSGYNTVDIDFFKKESIAHRRQSSFSAERAKYPKYLFLFVGQLIPRKGVKEVLQALVLLRNKDIGFIIIGDGPEKESLENYCEKHNLNNVYFKGHKQIQEIIKYYALADFLIMPSLREVWGLVLNEALASGLFVLSSKYAGATFDLVQEGKNGFIIDPCNIQDIKDKILKALKLNLDKEKISKTMNKFLPEKYAENLIKAIKLVI